MATNHTNTSSGIIDRKAMKDAHQTIAFGVDNVNVAKVTSANVILKTSPLTAHPDSDEIILKSDPLDYSWDATYYSGRFLAVHMSGKYIAFGIQSAGESHGLIKVINKETMDNANIRSFRGTASDIAFAVTMNAILLGCVTKSGEIFVYEIVQGSGFIQISANLLLHIKRPADDKYDGPCHLSWCPYIIDDEIGEYDPAQTFAVSKGSRVHIWDLQYYRKSNSKTVTIIGSENTPGFLEIKMNSSDVNVLCFQLSPDSSTIALSNSEGYLLFFQINLEANGESQLLHKWKPYDNDKCIHGMFFLDDHRMETTNLQFWKDMVTIAGDMDPEIRLWCCETWTCLQIISISSEMNMYPSLDFSARYLTMLDVTGSAVFIFHFDKSENPASIDYVGKFHFPFNVENISIVDSTECSNADKEKLKAYILRTKSVQECEIIFNLEKAMPPNVFYKFPQHTPNDNSTPFTTPLKSHPVRLGAEKTNGVLSCTQLENSIIENLKNTANNLEADQSKHTGRNSKTGSNSSLEVEAANAFQLSGYESENSYASGRSSVDQEVENLISATCHEDERTAIKSGIDPHTTPSGGKDGQIYNPFHSSNASGSQLPVSNDKAYMDYRFNALEAGINELHNQINHQNKRFEKLENDLQRLTKTRASSMNKDVSNVSVKLTKYLDELDGLKVFLNSNAEEIILQEFKKSHDNLVNIIVKMFTEIFTRFLTSCEFAKPYSNMVKSMMMPAMKNMTADIATCLVVPKLEFMCENVCEKVTAANVSLAEKLCDNYKSFTVDKYNELFTSLKAQVQGLKSELEITTTASKTEIEKSLNKMEAEIKGTVENLMEQHKVAIENLLDANQKSANQNSEAELRNQLLNLVSQGKYNTAFQTALMKFNPKIVMFLCSKLDYHKIFSKQNGIHQHILFSVIQQLSASNLAVNPDAKIKIIESAILNLDKNSKDFLPNILYDVRTRLQTFLSTMTPSQATYNSVRLILMAIDSLCAPPSMTP